jgi:hypothetical protein
MHPVRRRVRRWLQRFFAALSPAALAGLVAACASPMTPAAKLNDAVQETNMAMRMGRNDIAIEHVSIDGRAQFIAHHKTWGGEVSIVDIEFGGVEKMTEQEAVVLVGFQWFRPSEGQLRNTVVRQTWKNDKGSGPWWLAAEETASGDVGLFGDKKVKVVVPEKKNVHFETVTIPSQ